jgi:hypothetical protein
MDLYLDKSLLKLNQEITDFKPRTQLLSRKNDDPVIFNWMKQYCIRYHQLVKEFNPSSLKITINQKHHLNTTTSKNKIEHYLDILFKNGILDISFNQNKNQNQNSTSIIDPILLTELNKALKSKDKTKPLSEWFNKYNEEIYYPSKKNISFIQYLEYLKQNHSSEKTKEVIKDLLSELEQYNMFMSFNIQTNIQNGFKYEYRFNDSELEFLILSNENIPAENIYWRFLYARMKSISRLYVTGEPPKIKFKILLTDQLKKLPRKGQLFGPEEVNSGSTDYQTITLWRKEEHFKVILHESIHFYNLDGSLDLSHQNDNINLEKHFQIAPNTKTRIYEAYTETLAIFLNSFANAYQIYYFNQKQSDDLDFNIINQIRIFLWKQEKKFFLLQIAKIFIHVFNTSADFRDFLMGNDTEKDGPKLEQRTSLLSYHIIKGANVLFDLEFLEWLKNPLDPHPKSLFKFTEYILQKTHNSDFINLVNKAIKYLKNKENKSGGYNKSLRMSSYETQF